MPSPFPGMDPFIEGQRWRDFHTRYITVLGEFLTPQVRPRYVVDVEEYVFLGRESADDRMMLEPDLSLSDRLTAESDAAATAGTATAVKPVVRTVPMPHRVRQPYLTLRRRDDLEVVTVIELLSPWNKTAGLGQNEYLNKRHNVFATPANLVEIDLLRGGQRLPTVEPLEEEDYYVFVCRRERLPSVDVYSWSLEDPLPCIPIPLAADDADVLIDLQQAFITTYDRAGYDYSLDYERKVQPIPDAAKTAYTQALRTVSWRVPGPDTLVSRRVLDGAVKELQ